MLDLPLPHFPELKTDRLVLRELLLSDTLDIYQIFASNEVTYHYDLETFSEVDQARELVERQSKRFEHGEGIRWGIAQKSDNIIVGTCGYRFSANSQGEIGYDLAFPYWRRGIMSEALTAMFDFGFETLKLHRIQALVMVNNVASAKLLSKLGFHEEGILREYAFFKGQYHDLRCFSLLSSDFDRFKARHKRA